MSDSFPALIAFGPSTEWPNDDTLDRVRGILLKTPYLQPLIDGIRTLPQFWRTLVEFEPSLSNTPGLLYIQKLAAWLDHGHLTLESNAADHHQLGAANVLITPLTVLVQIAHYVDYLSKDRRQHSEIDNSTILSGFCTGLLAACAVASSNHEEDLGLNTCISLRLAVAIGAFVDLKECQREVSERTCCFVARWTSPSSKARLHTVVDRTAHTYISVEKDDCSATVSTRESTYRTLIKDLHGPGLLTRPIFLRGQFHALENSDIFDSLARLVQASEQLQFSTLKIRVFPLANPSNDSSSPNQNVARALLEAILLSKCDWAHTFPDAALSIPITKHRSALSIGLVHCISPSVAQRCSIEVIPTNFGAETPTTAPVEPPAMENGLDDKSKPCYNTQDAIAIVGMACRFPEADTPEEFWDLLVRGASTVRQVPQDRFGGDAAESDAPRWGNFLRNPGAFDHKFFKMSAREALYTDPQQRLVLEVAYEALRSSGYLRESEREKSVGCYMGVGSVDYIDNISSNSHNAFSATGSLRAFISGKVSHYFDWAGPALTFDTACSSSLVAIHNACKDIRSGECKMAIAGGVNVISSPFLYEALGAASFLSSTGASHAFEDSANGYCRGEGCGIVVLKRLSDALQDGDRILATIPGSGVNQNSAASPITVPDSSSQANLYRQISVRAGIEPKNVTYVEAHGTGTARGDPVELQSIRDVFGRSAGDKTLYLGSVKNNIGHLEAASGIAALIKVILMIQKKSIPPHARFKKLRTNVAPLEEDNMIIPTTVHSWNADWKAACVNNYGASGCNSSLIVCQAPSPTVAMNESMTKSSFDHTQHLFRVSAHSESALKQMCKSIQNYTAASFKGDNLAQLASELAYRVDASHAFTFTTTASTVDELQARIATAVASQKDISPSPTNRTPIVLCFGGQTRDYVGLSPELYYSCPLFKHHTDACIEVCKSLGLEDAILPAIFEKRPIGSIVKLHCSLFALQYASAKSWIDAGMTVDTLVGHSFGQFTALCVAGVLTLDHALRYVINRAQYIENSWNSEKGSMLALETDLATVRGLTSDEVGIACYNSHNSFVLSGPAKSLDDLETQIQREGNSLGIRTSKRLAVTHGFHSHLMDPIIPELLATATTLSFQKPVIPFEECSHGGWEGRMTPERLVSHSREPVFFTDAIERIAARFPQAVWVEAGSSSGITSMIKRILKPDASRMDVFLPMNMDRSSGLDNVTDAVKTMSEVGVQVNHWCHYGRSSSDMSYMDLPPYSFEKTDHWLPYISPTKGSLTTTIATRDEFIGLLRFINFTDNAKLNAVFEVNCSSEEYKLCVAGHAVAGHGLCPVSLYVEILSRAMMIFKKSSENTPCLPSIDDLKILSPLGLDPSDTVSLILTQIPEKQATWDFEFVSGTISATKNTMRHATGTASLESQNSSSLKRQRRQFQHFLDATNPKSILDDTEVTSLQGPLIYDIFGAIVDYQDYYRCVKRIASKGDVSVGSVVDPPQGILQECITNPLAVDNFLQVAGIHVNVLSKRKSGHVLVCTNIGRMTAYDQQVLKPKQRKWLVYAVSDSLTDNMVESDIYVSEQGTGALVLSLTGIRFVSVVEASLKRLLGGQKETGITEASYNHIPTIERQQLVRNRPAFVSESEAGSESTGATFDALPKLKDIIASLCDIPSQEVANESLLEDIGVDSLLMSEVIREINSAFGIALLLSDVPGTLTTLGLSLVIGQRVTDLDLTKMTPTSSVGPPSSIVDISNKPLPTIPLLESSGQDINSQLAEVLSNILGVTIDGYNVDMSLQDAGLDSLVAMEVSNDIKVTFGIHIPTEKLVMINTFADLLRLIEPTAKASVAKPTLIKEPAVALPDKTNDLDLSDTSKCFAELRGKFDSFSRETGVENFQQEVYPAQAELVVSYVIEAFKKLGCDLAQLPHNAMLPLITTLPVHSQLVSRLYAILQDANLIAPGDTRFIRTSCPVSEISPAQAFEKIIEDFPKHADEHSLLHTTGQHLAELLTGERDPIATIFGAKDSMQLMGRVYTHAPLFATGTKLLVEFLTNLLSKKSGARAVRILEIGAGTGGTTSTLINTLMTLGVEFEYWFTDVSPSFVNAAKRRFATCKSMKYATVNIEKELPSQLHSYFDIAISTNCIHATQDLVQSTSHIRQCLRANGMLCLLELTRTYYWFDLVFGLLDGWWRFQDGREYALVDETRWNRVLHSSGYSHIDWTIGDSEESKHLRLILACNKHEDTGYLHSNRLRRVLHAQAYVETIQFSEQQGVPLLADIYYPLRDGGTRGLQKRPVALMIHGGGHIMLSRKDIRHSQLELLFQKGFLPISVDYRLCPEVALEDGAMHDVCAALNWIRTELPKIHLAHPCIGADGDRVVAVGWSTGGTLAMSLAFKAPMQQTTPPEAILAFYCPTSYTDSFWQEENVPVGTAEWMKASKFRWGDALSKVPLTSYKLPASDARSATGGWMAQSNPRSQLALHMNWRGQTLPILMGALALKNTSDLSPRRESSDAQDLPLFPQPSPREIVPIDPHSNIQLGKYESPTFIIHGTDDDLIPLQQVKSTFEAMQKHNVTSQLRVVEGAPHLFDLDAESKAAYSADARKAIEDGYDFLSTFVN